MPKFGYLQNLKMGLEQYCRALFFKNICQTVYKTNIFFSRELRKLSNLGSKFSRIRSLCWNCEIVLIYYNSSPSLKIISIYVLEECINFCRKCNILLHFNQTNFYRNKNWKSNNKNWFLPNLYHALILSSYIYLIFTLQYNFFVESDIYLTLQKNCQQQLL